MSQRDGPDRRDATLRRFPEPAVLQGDRPGRKLGGANSGGGPVSTSPAARTSASPAARTSAP